MSSFDSSKSKTWTFSSIRLSVTDFGRGTYPFGTHVSVARFIEGSWVSRPYLLQAPPNQDLSGRFVVLLSQVLQHRLVHPLGPDKGRICLDDNIALSKPLHDIVPGAPGVDLILANVDLTATTVVDVFLKFIEVVHSEVGYSNWAHLPCLLGLYKRLPGAQTCLLSTVGGMDQDPFFPCQRMSAPLIDSRKLRTKITYRSM